MIFGDLNFIIILFFFILISLVINLNTALHLLLTAEFLWITLYVFSLFLGIVYDNLNILSLTFFFLVLSAVEFGLGLVIMLVQNIVMRSINLGDSNKNSFKWSLRFKNKLKINAVKFW
jgi:hypothetical protein